MFGNLLIIVLHYLFLIEGIKLKSWNDKIYYTWKKQDKKTGRYYCYLYPFAKIRRIELFGDGTCRGDDNVKKWKTISSDQSQELKPMRYYLAPKREALYSSQGITDEPKGAGKGIVGTAINLEGLLSRAQAKNIKWAKYKDRRGKNQPRVLTFNLGEQTFGLISKEINSRCLPLAVEKHWDHE